MRYIIGFLAFIMLIIILVSLLFRGGGKPKVPTTTRALDSYAASGGEVDMTIDGPINAAANHEQIHISVDRDNAVFEYIKGYEGNVVKMQSYSNDQTAFEVFLLALARAGFTQGNNLPALKDERGYCPLGNRYVFELKQNGRSIERYWATACGKPRSYLGATDLTIQLFRAQIPDFDKQIQAINPRTLAGV